MGHIAIQVEHLSKRYQLGATVRHDTLRDRLAHTFGALRKKRSVVDDAAKAFWALRDVSFDIAQGEVFGIIGHNGAGKSTLLKILSRITEPTSGTADIYGRLSSLLEVGTGFHPELTGRENIYLNAAILGMHRIEIKRKLDEIIDFSGIEEFIDTPVKRYSSGMYVRLAFSVAAHVEPEILIVDEVLAVGDASFQEKCLGKMQQASRGGRTVLIVSHNLPVIEHLCQRALLLSKGHVALLGEAKEVVEAYAGMTAELSRSALYERTDRQGKGQVIAAAIEMLDGNGNIRASAIGGRETILRWHYRCSHHDIIRNCRVELSLHVKVGDPYETAYFLMSTDLVDSTPLDLRGEGWIDFRLPELPLSGGNYYVMSYVESNREVQDWIHNAALLTVVDGDFYGTGKAYPPGWRGKCVLVKYSWKQGEKASPTCQMNTAAPTYDDL
ncbi:MAG: ABC transporter ATP-binding protein [Nitrospira sp.]|nr:ABC transporter ATP-binding protein [Nitrospira sp.]